MMNYTSVPHDTIIPFLSPEKLQGMIDTALSHPQERAKPSFWSRQPANDRWRVATSLVAAVTACMIIVGVLTNGAMTVSTNPDTAESYAELGDYMTLDVLEQMS